MIPGAMQNFFIIKWKTNNGESKTGIHLFITAIPTNINVIWRSQCFCIPNGVY